VSGINGSLARKIVKYREEKGKIASREELASVPGMGPKSFEQCAGFLKIPESTEALDNTWVHPENYPAARSIRDLLNNGTVTATTGISSESAATLKEKHGIGDTTIKDILEELKKPNRDPRSDYPKPVMQKGLVTFEDLKEGMTVTGKIKNVVDFGAFVDLGLKETALVHISELSDSYVKDPLELIKVGDILEFRIISLDIDRRRIGLSRKKEKAAAAQSSSVTGKGSNTSSSIASPSMEQNQRKPMPPTGSVKPRTDGSRQPGARPQKEFERVTSGSSYQGSDDGTMYNPFALAFQKAQSQKPEKKANVKGKGK
jgi:uncharacterized protein